MSPTSYLTAPPRSDGRANTQQNAQDEDVVGIDKKLL